MHLIMCDDKPLIIHLFSGHIKCHVAHDMDFLTKATEINFLRIQKACYFSIKRNTLIYLETNILQSIKKKKKKQTFINVVYYSLPPTPTPFGCDSHWIFYGSYVIVQLSHPLHKEQKKPKIVYTVEL